MLTFLFSEGCACACTFFVTSTIPGADTAAGKNPPGSTPVPPRSQTLSLRLGQWRRRIRPSVWCPSGRATSSVSQRGHAGEGKGSVCTHVRSVVGLSQAVDLRLLLKTIVLPMPTAGPALLRRRFTDMGLQEFAGVTRTPWATDTSGFGCPGRQALETSQLSVNANTPALPPPAAGPPLRHNGDRTSALSCCRSLSFCVKRVGRSRIGRRGESRR